MFLVEMDFLVGPVGERLTDDEITDLIERVVDVLDNLPLEPSVGTCRVGNDVEMTIGVVVDDDDQFEALRHGAAIISGALEAVIGISSLPLIIPRDDQLRSSVRVLQAV